MGHRIVTAILGPSVSLLASKLAPSSSGAWSRTSYNGGRVSLLGGAHMFAGLSASAIAGSRLADAVALAAGGIAGYVDDHLEDKFAARGKGFKGHVGALGQGKITSGLVKIAVIGGGATLSAAALKKPRGVVNIAIDSLLIASSANLFNLLDLRPGRALKAGIACALPFVFTDSSDVAVGLIGASGVCIRDDLRGQTMLGDLGANTLGAQIGVLIAREGSLPLRMTMLATVAGLTALSERVSFSHVIENNRVLNYIDQLGR